MKKISNMREYLNIIKNVKKQCSSPMTNMYSLLNSVNRYIASECFMYQMQERGICFLCDERLYYRMFYYIDADEEFSIEYLDKPIAVRNIFTAENKQKELIRLEEKLKRMGFYREYSAIEMCVPVEYGDTIAKQKELYDRILRKGKFRIARLKKEDLSEMLVMRNETSEFHIYNFENKSISEYYEEIDRGQYIGIYDEQNKICASIYTASGFNFRTGDGICVKQEYKKRYGLGAALMVYVLDEALNGYRQNYVSWCERENIESMKFHEKIGFKNTGKVADEWIWRK